MAREKILLIEDDRELQEIMSGFLKKEGYEVVQAYDGEEGICLAKEAEPTLVLLDLMLPGADGFEVCRMIRTKSVVPIMVISAKNSDMDKMLSLGIGADDYMEKPFSMQEMLARVKSHIRRYTSFSKPKEEESCIVMGEVEIEPLSYKVRVCGRNIELTSREFELLNFMASHPGRVFSKEQLLDAVWGCTEYIDENTITVYIGRIREKMVRAGVCYIKTVWGAGYKWEM